MMYDPCNQRFPEPGSSIVLHSWFNQHIFDETAAHMFHQGRRAMGEGGCAYRGSHLLEGSDAPQAKCAVGYWVPDNEYDFRMEGSGIFRLIAETRVHSYYCPTLIAMCSRPHTFRLLSDLQNVHDNADNWGTTASMQGALLMIAGRFNLNTDKSKLLTFADR